MTKRMFVDPGTNSTGWAMFEGEELIDSGTITATKGQMFDRILTICNQFKSVSACHRPDEVVFERMNRMVNVAVIWAVGAIGLAIKLGNPSSVILSESKHQISPSSWKKFERLNGVWNTHRQNADSEDEVVAILIGLVYLSNLKDEKPSDAK